MYEVWIGIYLRIHCVVLHSTPHTHTHTAAKFSFSSFSVHLTLSVHLLYCVCVQRMKKMLLNSIWRVTMMMIVRPRLGWDVIITPIFEACLRPHTDARCFPRRHSVILDQGNAYYTWINYNQDRISRVCVCVWVGVGGRRATTDWHLLCRNVELGILWNICDAKDVAVESAWATHAVLKTMMLILPYHHNIDYYYYYSSGALQFSCLSRR